MKLHEILSEVYSKKNQTAFDYFRNNTRFSTYDDEIIGTILWNWLDSKMDEDELYDIAEKHGISVQELMDDSEHGSIRDSILYDILSDSDTRQRFFKFAQEFTDSETPPYLSMDLTNKNLLHRQTWLTHFVNNLNDLKSIGEYGFLYGHSDIQGIHLTHHKIDRKLDKGYNFAFISDSTDAKKSIKYGDHFVMFQNSGIPVYHYGDKENQVIFHGTDVNPRDIILIMKKDFKYHVLNKATFIPIYSDSNYLKIINWVKNNFTQYRKVLTGF